MTGLSVIVPVFNTEAYAERCIRSILAQSFKDLELIIVNDGSGGNIGEIAGRFMAADPRVKKDPAPFARLSGGTNEAMQFTVRAWCDSAEYWNVYFDLTQAITEKLGEAGVQAPAVWVISEK